MEFKNRVPSSKNRVLITPENGTSAFNAVITRQDNPEQGNEGTMLEAGIFNNLSEEIKNSKVKSEKAIENSTKALDILENLTVTSTEVDSLQSPSVEISTAEDTGRKTLKFFIPKSKQGKSYRNRGEWANDVTYYNDDLYIDTVTLNGSTYYAKLNNFNKKPSDNSSNSYWGILVQRGDASTGVINDIINTIYPVGSIYMSVDSASPNSIFGGNWERLQDRFLLGASDNNYPIGTTGGSKDAVVISHNHTLSDSGLHSHTLGSGGSHIHSSTTPGNTNGDYLSESSKGSAWRGIGSGWNTGESGLHTHTVIADGSHTHIVNERGVDGKDKNMPPYLAVYMWKRVS